MCGGAALCVAGLASAVTPPARTAPYRRIDADHALHGARRFSADAMSPRSPRSAHITRLNTTTPRTIFVNRSERRWLKPHSVVHRMRDFS